MQPYKVLIIYCLLFILISSCSSQNTATQSNPISKGQSALWLDHKIWSIYQDSKDNYWFGSNGNGVFKYDGKQLLQYTKKDGLVDNTIRGIQGDHLGNVFIGTPDGVSQYDGNRFTTLQPIIDTANEWKLTPTDLWFR